MSHTDIEGEKEAMSGVKENIPLKGGGKSQEPVEELAGVLSDVRA